MENDRRTDGEEAVSQPPFELVAEGALPFEQNTNFAVARPKVPRGAKGGAPPLGGQEHRGGNGPHWGRRIALGTASLLAAAGIGFGADRTMNNGDDDPERGAVSDVTPLSEPKREATPEATPTVSPTETISPEDQKAPYSKSFSVTFGDATLSTQEGLEKRETCPDPNLGPNPIACTPMEKVVPNTEDFAEGEAEELFNTGVKKAKYEIWKARNPEEANLSFEQFEEKLKGDNPVVITAKGTMGSSYLPENIEIDLRKPVEFVWTNQPNTHKYSTGNSFSYRLAEGKLVIEIYDVISGKAFLDGSSPQRYKYASSAWVSTSLAYLADEDSAIGGGFLRQAEFDKLNQFSSSKLLPLFLTDSKIGYILPY